MATFIKIKVLFCINMSEAKIKKEVKALEKKVKYFKKIAKKDAKEGKILAKEIEQDCKKLQKVEIIKQNNKLMNKLGMLIESSEMYLKTAESLQKFQKKWERKN